MHLSSALAVTLFFISLHQSTAQMSKEAQEQCMADMMGKQKAETDKDLVDKMTKTHLILKGTLDIVQGLNDGQKDKLRNTYFTGVPSEQCMAQMMGIHKAETDKDLADKLMKAQVMIKSTVDIVKGLSDAQKDKLRNTYFVGV
ncbi:hypothetical protein PENTCL1PPCAC_12020 [Pristionchus entomophagus]|uniref:Uncharacterized protein n=1 Tax=Pristionchus entomophagus TaxID=358040 RepID=A0AAV5T434_9BILA|nr:hypothetical protein PENTCL1PPCAC_12020 [Pristionchus entomophagus]